MTSWISTESALPGQEVLVWTGRRFAIAAPATRADGSRFFMDAHTDKMLAWPSHWMPLPNPPADEGEDRRS